MLMLTPINEKAKNGPDVTGRNEREIEVTAEMIEAGALALSQYDREYETLEEGAIRIYLAMVRKRET